MKLLASFRGHVGGDLSAYCHGELPAEKLQRVAEHLEACPRCRRACEDVRFGVTLAGLLPRLQAPASLADGLKARLEQAAPDVWSTPPRRVATVRMPWRPLGAVALLAALALGVVGYLRTSRAAPELELTEYLRGVQTSSGPSASGAIARAPLAFSEAQPAEVLRVAGLVTPSAAGAPLPASRLLANRLALVGGTLVAELVYEHGDDRFAVFVAPARVRFRLGKESVVDAEVEGIRCSKVDCPRQETYVFGAGSFHCVLVSKSLAVSTAAEIMRYFIAAHEHAQRG